MTGVIFDIQRYAIHDGPGIRTTIFLKGCPLACAWCQNPESRNGEPQIALLPNRCIQCGRCIEVCPRRDGAAGDSDDANKPATRPAACLRCGACAAACPSGARTRLGRDIDIPELIRELARDEMFYDESDGGVTFSGGEPLMQDEFLLAALRACRERGYRTAVDTCGYAPTETLLGVAKFTDLFLYDLKLLHAERHWAATGVPNGLILENLRLLSEHGAAIWIRFPLIPGVNDDDANLDALAAVVAALRPAPPVHILPYHRIGGDKYARLGLEYALDAVESPTKQQIEFVTGRLTAGGLKVKVGG